MALTDKMIRFCNEYLIDLNATQAAIRSGYSEHTASSIGAENLTKPEIREFIEKRQKELEVQLGLSQEWVLRRLKDISDKSVQAVPVLEWDYEAKEFRETGEYKFDSAGANRATELIGKHLGMFINKIDLTTKGDSLNDKRAVVKLPDGTTLEI